METSRISTWAALTGALVSAGCAQSYDIVIRDGTVIDGTGAVARPADVAIQGDRIVGIGDVPGTAAMEIDATGLIVAPGFIDMHSHSDRGRPLDGLGPSFSLQGITTEIYGETSSMGPLGGLREDMPTGSAGNWQTLGEFLTWLEPNGVAANFGSYVGSGGVRAVVMGYEDRSPTDAELDDMKRLVREAMAQGALGVSSGMSYVPNIYMSTEELTALVAEASAAGGLYATHARTMNGTDPSAITEAIEVADGAGTRLHFFHLNSTSSTEADTFLGIIREARSRGIPITGDSYTYTWGITGLASYIPAWAQEGGREAMLERLRDPDQRRRIAAGFVTEPPYLANVGWHHIRFGVDDPEVNGKLVSEVAELRGQAPEEVFMDVVLERGGEGIVIDWNNEEETLRQTLAEPYVTGGTDGGAINLEGENLPPLVHPRHLGTFPRFLGTYVRDEGLLSWEEAIHKITGLAAEVLALEDRGTLEVGNFADVVVFDPDEIRGVATFEDPFHYAEGIRFVFVNGKAVVADGVVTGALPGRALRGPGYRPEGGTAGGPS
jgi:N-acyl-D-amino-acid deacylase